MQRIAIRVRATVFGLSLLLLASEAACSPVVVDLPARIASPPPLSEANPANLYVVSFDVPPSASPVNVRRAWIVIDGTDETGAPLPDRGLADVEVGRGLFLPAPLDDVLVDVIADSKRSTQYMRAELDRRDLGWALVVEGEENRTATALEAAKAKTDLGPLDVALLVGGALVGGALVGLVVGGSL